MIKRFPIFLLGFLAFSPVIVSAQGNSPVQNIASSLNLTAAQKQSIIDGDTSVIVQLAEDAGISFSNPAEAGAFAEALVMEVIADMSAAELSANALTVSKTVISAVKQLGFSAGLNDRAVSVNALRGTVNAVRKKSTNTPGSNTGALISSVVAGSQDLIASAPEPPTPTYDIDTITPPSSEQTNVEEVEMSPAGA